jgi:hypothetical protein
LLKKVSLSQSLIGRRLLTLASLRALMRALLELNTRSGCVSVDSKYIALTCRNTFACWLEYREYGFWIPVRVKGVTESAAVPGYGFIPYQRWPALRRAARVDYHIRVLEYDLVERPRMVFATDLVKMQQAVNRPPDAVPILYSVGERIMGIGGLFGGREGVITHVRKSKVRVLFGTQPWDLPFEFIEKCG